MRIDVAFAQLRGRVRACVTAQAHFFEIGLILASEVKYPYPVEGRRSSMRVDRARIFDDRANQKAAADSRHSLRRSTSIAVFVSF